MASLFSPGKTVNIAVGAASQAVKVSDQRGVQQVRVKNDGTATVWVAFGDSAVAASTASGIPLGSGETEGFTVMAPINGPLYAAAIAAGSTGTIYFTPGSGI
jgi:hypothetical protein